jgi:hypothetical protein
MDTAESRTFAARPADLLKHERHTMADFLVALAEFDRQRGWVALGYSGLFSFLNRQLGLSKAASFFRKTAAELIQRYPEIVEPLRDGRLCLSSMASLAKVLTPANRADVLPRFFHRSALEAKSIVAELTPDPKPPTRTVVTVTPVRILPAVVDKMPAATAGGSACEPRRLDVSTIDRPAPLILQPSPTLRVEPLTPTETRIHVTVSPAFLEKLEAARLALSHSMPRASEEDVLSAGLDLLLDRDAKRKGLVAKPRPAPADAPATPGALYIPASVRREVWERDRGKCQWPVDGGGICRSRLRTELDHVQLRCRGGRPVAADLRVTCDFHNHVRAARARGRVDEPVHPRPEAARGIGPRLQRPGHRTTGSPRTLSGGGEPGHGYGHGGA